MTIFWCGEWSELTSRHVVRMTMTKLELSQWRWRWWRFHIVTMMVAHAYARLRSRTLDLAVFISSFTPLPRRSKTDWLPRRCRQYLSSVVVVPASTSSMVDRLYWMWFGRMTLMDHKLKDIGPKLRSFDFRGAYAGWLQRYHANYIVPGKFTPIIHCALLIGGIGYALEWTFKGRTTSAHFALSIRLSFATAFINV